MFAWPFWFWNVDIPLLLPSGELPNERTRPLSLDLKERIDEESLPDTLPRTRGVPPEFELLENERDD